jgi:two-component system response regulator VicR
MLTARGEEVDRVLGLDLGADDYVTKPFSVPELLARIRAIFRRIQQVKSGELPDSLKFGKVSIDFKRFDTRIEGEAVKLTRKEYGIMRLLASRIGEVITRDELLDEVWGYDQYPTTRTIDNHLGLLRNKLEEDPANPRHLITVHGVGYKLVLDE